MASTDILSQTLSSITAIKLAQLQEQKQAYENKKRSLLEDVVSEVDTAKRAKRLLKGTEDLRSVGLKKSATLSGLQDFLDQAEYDPSVTEPMLKEYEAELQNHMQAQTNKYEFASLYGKLVEEWIASGASEAASSDIVVVGREEMHQQRAIWEEYAFNAKETDKTAIKAYLDDVFSSKEAQRALDTIRTAMKTFQKDWKSKRHFDEDTLETCIKGMLRTDTLTEEKRTTLRDFLGNKVVLSEIADVLNMRMSTISTWTWGAPLIVEQRRNLNGRYRFYTDEDLLHSIFVYYIGLRWAVALREQLQAFIGAEGVWKPDTKPISKSDSRRRQFFLNDNGCTETSVQQNRDMHFRRILLDQLPESFNEVRGGYGDIDDKAEDTKLSHVQTVRELLQRLQAEILMQTKLDREITVIRSDFKWFGPSIPHSTIFAVLEFFGINTEWMDFFKRVLESSIRFKNDSPDTPAQVRKRGTLVSTPIADFFGESMLFCLDYAVNQKASGTRLYRLHDDMWLWGASETCAKAWVVVTNFTETMGLDLNEEKTGSVRIPKHGAALSKAGPGTLPKGDVKWGFLKLDPATGRFLIDQQEVDKHIEELRLQLSACRSVFDYVQAWNIYGNRFFSNNFGKPANCYGRAHIDSILSTFRRIQERLFPNLPGGVGEHLKRTIASRFGLSASDIPDGYLYWPSSMGGLGLQNPFISPLLSRRNLPKKLDKVMDEFIKEEEFDYARAKARFEDDLPNASDYRSPSWASDVAPQTWRDRPEWKDLQNQPFMPFEEFVRHRERTSDRLAKAYFTLLREPNPVEVEATGEVQAALAESKAGDKTRKDGRWGALSDVERWVVQLYHKDMVVRFGGLDVVDQGLLPTGLMTMLRESRFRWQG